jgi:3-hydroxyisobutyrate dehydrogenase-like beta-hydroxyacid dehydrogenase
VTTIAFIGFGEAAQAIAADLNKADGVSRLLAYDLRFADGAGDLKDAASARGVEPLTDIGGIGEAAIVLSLVVGAAAIPVARSAAPHLRDGQFYVDLNSIGPEAKTRVGETLANGGGGAFVEGAVMARVPPYGARVPILLAGSRAVDAAERLNALGMCCEAVGERIGQASAVKMIRSVIIKGVEALLIESLTAAERAGVTERILDSIADTFPGIDWRETATYYIGRTHQHGARRVTEMNESAETLRSLGVEPILSSAIAATIASAHARLASAALPPNAHYEALLGVLAQEGVAAMVSDGGR